MAQITWNKLTLFNPVTKKYWNIEIDGTIIRTCRNHGAVKETEELNYPVDKAIQAVTAQLKKGFIYTNPSANVGEAIFHCYIDKRQSYTGFLPIAARTDRDDFYIVRVIGKFENEILYHYNADGQLLSINQLDSKRLAYRAELDIDGTLYFDNSHKMEHYDPKKAQFLHMTDDTATKETRPEAVICKHLRIDYRKGRGSIEIWDNRNESLILKLTNEFAVKNINCACSSKNLIVHTDYGVLSLYKMNI